MIALYEYFVPTLSKLPFAKRPLLIRKFPMWSDSEQNKFPEVLLSSLEMKILSMTVLLLAAILVGLVIVGTKLKVFIKFKNLAECGSLDAVNKFMLKSPATKHSVCAGSDDNI